MGSLIKRDCDQANCAVQSLSISDRVPNWEEMGATPGVFVRVANKGLIAAHFVRVANTRLSDGSFGSLALAQDEHPRRMLVFVRVANKGLTRDRVCKSEKQRT
jgi:hypothetical protein